MEETGNSILIGRQEVSEWSKFYVITWDMTYQPKWGRNFTSYSKLQIFSFLKSVVWMAVEWNWTAQRIPVPVQSLSRVRLSVTPWIAACQASLSITNSQSSLRLMSIESVMPSSLLILCRPLLLPPPIHPPLSYVNEGFGVIVSVLLTLNSSKK